jgi:hypothetical protein
MSYIDKFKAISDIYYEDLMLDDYSLIGCGSYRRQSLRDASNVLGREKAVDHYITAFSRKFNLSKKKVCIYFNDEVGTSKRCEGLWAGSGTTKNYELDHGHNHILVSKYQHKEVDPDDAVKFSDYWWRNHYGICTFEKFDPERKRNGVSYVSKHSQNGLLVLNNAKLTKAMERHLDYLKKQKNNIKTPRPLDWKDYS